MLTLTDSSLDYMFRCWREQSQRTRYIRLPGEDPRSALAKFVESQVREATIACRKRLQRQRDAAGVIVPGAVTLFDVTHLEGHKCDCAAGSR